VCGVAALKGSLMQVDRCGKSTKGGSGTMKREGKSYFSFDPTARTVLCLP
jgi:hypothetical protein